MAYTVSFLLYKVKQAEKIPAHLCLRRSVLSLTQRIHPPDGRSCLGLFVVKFLINLTVQAFIQP